MTGTANRVAELTKEATELDATFSAALQRHYGNRAGDMRYRKASEWPRDVRVAWAHWAQAMAALRLHQEWSRAKTRAEQDHATARCRDDIARILEESAN